MCAAQLAQAQKFDPNAPTKKTVTVGSEIKRGSSAVFDATLSKHADVIGNYEAAEKVIQQNRQQNTDTDGFLLGAQFRAWTGMMVLARLDSRVVNTALANQIGRIYFDGYRKLQRQMGIDDATLCELASLRYEAIKGDIEKWSKSK